MGCGTVENLDSADPETVKVVIQRHVPYIIAEEDGTFTVAVGYVPAMAAKTADWNKKITPSPKRDEALCNVAGAEGLEPSTNGFGDHYSTS